MSDYTANDLKNDVHKNENVNIDSRGGLGGKGKLEILNINEFDGRDYWCFEAKELETNEKTKWRYKVYPNKGGSNNGVVEAHWYNESGKLGGHHELYPRAFVFN